jgi:hypothetical protein
MDWGVATSIKTKNPEKLNAVPCHAGGCGRPCLAAFIERQQAGANWR